MLIPIKLTSEIKTCMWRQDDYDDDTDYTTTMSKPLTLMMTTMAMMTMTTKMTKQLFSYDDGNLRHSDKKEFAPVPFFFRNLTKSTIRNSEGAHCYYVNSPPFWILLSYFLSLDGTIVDKSVDCNGVPPCFLANSMDKMCKVELSARLPERHISYNSATSVSLHVMIWLSTDFTECNISFGESKLEVNVEGRDGS